MARKFFYVCAGMLMLALSYHFGASSATAQAGSGISGFTVGDGPGVANAGLYVMSLNGDVNFKHTSNMAAPPCLIGNFWAGGATASRQETWGQLKSRYAPNPGRATQGATDR